MNKKCPVSGVNMPRFFLMVIAGFLVAFGYDFVVHGHLLMEEYQSTMALWRTPTQMEVYFPFSLMMTFVYVFVLGFIFTRNYEGKGPKEGMRFGFYLGSLVGVMQFSFYAYMPISMTLAGGWLAATIVQAMILGVVFSLIYTEGDCTDKPAEKSS